MMKKLIFSIIVLFSFLTVNAQNVTDAKGKKQGPWQKTFPKSKALEYEGTFKNDKPVGRFTYYYPSKKVKAIIKHDDMSYRAEAFFYHENGQILSYGIYKNLKKDSVWLNFGPSGRISFKETYSNDILNGEKVIYFVPEELYDKSIRVSSSMNYVTGVLDGEYREYFDNGVTRTTGTYLNGKKNGIWEDFQPNGNKLSFSRYKSGVKHGWCMAYDESGVEINRVYFYKGDMKTGKDLKLLMEQMKEKGVNPND